MSADEGASWAAASAPNVGEVLRLQAQLNPGKLALHDLAAHAWIGAFGDGLVSMRAMSAALGTFAIVMVFLVGRELMLLSLPNRTGDSNRMRDAGAIGALSALIFAVSTVPIGYAREMRMYPVLLVAVLAQVCFFLRAARVGGIKNYVGVGVFTALALAAHFSAFCVPASEGLWLLCLFALRRGAIDATARPDTAQSAQMYRIATRSTIWKLAASIALGVAITAPVMRGALQASAAAVGAGALNWIRPPTLWDAATVLNGGVGKFLLPMIGAIGAVLGWRWAPGAVLFALMWMWVPVMMLLLVSYTLTPLLVERYVLSSFVPLFILIAMAVWSISTPAGRWGGLAIVIMLALGQDVRFYKHRHNDAQWREAATIANSSAGPGQSIGVVPAYAANVVRYYLSPERRSVVVAGVNGRAQAAPAVVIVFDQGLSPVNAAALRASYPHRVANLQRLTVMRR